MPRGSRYNGAEVLNAGSSGGKENVASDLLFDAIDPNQDGVIEREVLPHLSVLQHAACCCHQLRYDFVRPQEFMQAVAHGLVHPSLPYGEPEGDQFRTRLRIDRGPLTPRQLSRGNTLSANLPWS